MRRNKSAIYSHDLINSKNNNLLTPSKNDFNYHCQLHPFSQADLNYEDFVNQCSGGPECKNIPYIKKLELIIKKLKMTIADLSKLNDYFLFTIKQKDKMYRSLLKENISFKKSLMLTKKNKLNGPITIPQKLERDSARTTRRSEEKSTNIFDFFSSPFISQSTKNADVLSNRTLKSAKRQSMNDVLELKSKEKITNSLLYSEEKLNNNALLNSSHYENIVEVSTKTNRQKMQNSGGVSFLALSNKKLEEIANNKNLEFITQLTQREESFIKKIRTLSKENLSTFCDILNTVVKDYQHSIRLIQRLKLFMLSSIDLVRSILKEDSTNVLLTNACKILECERASLFIYDNLSDKLIVHTGEGVKKNEIKVAKDEGIVGTVFMKGEKLKIDDAYQDPRFNQEVDRQTLFKTKNLLCFPLISIDGETFGVIQAVNKIKKHFNHDDEELMLIFSKQASAILKNMMNMNVNTLQIWRLKIIYQYCIDLSEIFEINVFTKRTEQLLMDLFLSSNAQLLFVTKENYLYHSTEDKTFQKKNIGIMNYVVKSKECHGCKKPKDCRYYNGLIDIPAIESLVTFPIIMKDKCIGVMQTMVNCDLNEKNEKPKQNEMDLFLMIEECCKQWYLKNDIFF